VRLPARNRFVRWAGRGIWENLFRQLAGNGRATGTQMIDSTHIKAHRSAAGGKGGEQKQAVDRSRGGRNTKIHALADAKGRRGRCVKPGSGTTKSGLGQIVDTVSIRERASRG
jgi:hypothetical protein